MKLLNLRANGGKHQKLLMGNNVTGKCLHAHMQHFFSRSPAIEKTFAESSYFHIKKKLSWNRWIYEPMRENHQKLLLGNNAPGKCLHAHMQHFFSPSPAIEKKFAQWAFFHTKIKNLPWNCWIYEPMGANTKNYSWATMSLASAFTPTCNISSALAPLSRKNSPSQHFFIQKSKTCHETVEFTSQTGGKHQKLLLGNNALGKCLHAHMQHFFSRSTAIEKKFAESAFFHTKIKNLPWNCWIYEPMGANTKNYSWATMSLASAFTHTCNISSALAPLSRKNSLSQHFFLQKSKTCHETVEFTSQWGQTPKTTHGQQCHW